MNKILSRSRGLQKLVVPQPFKKFPEVYGKQKFTIVLTNKTSSTIIITFTAGKFPRINCINTEFLKKKSQGQTQITAEMYQKHGTDRQVNYI